MKRLLCLLTAAVSPFMSAQGGVVTQPIDPRDRPLRGELRVLPVSGNVSNPADFCRLGPGGVLIVRVRNIGRTPTSSQRVRVTFLTQPPGTSQSQEAPIPRLNGGARAPDLTFAIPSACGPGPVNCSFTIRAKNLPVRPGICIG
jgi:hypothetical protein